MTELYSFDHDLGQFVAIGTGTVSADGMTIESNSGGGWITVGQRSGRPDVSLTFAHPDLGRSKLYASRGRAAGQSTGMRFPGRNQPRDIDRI